ncbi:hypothetical protein IQ06DRAFT_310864 [Phaeosphaeriaceae sp. SRC1lsM3a]|nr:hypothetical protein IQ06DRAFT_310864 [Stagonospora sp. SRC1lsM3a]
MVNIIPYVASLLALGRAVTAAKAASSFSQWVEGILEDPEGDNMTPEEVINAYQSGHFDGATSAKFRSRSLFQKRATCYEQPNTDCLYVEHPKNTYSVSALRISSNFVPSPLGCIDNRWYTRFLLRIAAKERKVHRANSFFPHSNDVARGGGFILDSCVQAGYDRVEGSEFAYGSGHELVRLRRP